MIANKPKTIALAIVLCLFFMATASAYTTVVQMKLNSISAGSGDPTGIDKDCRKYGANQGNPYAYIVDGSQSVEHTEYLYDDWMVGEVWALGPVDLTSGNMYGITIYYDLTIGGPGDDDNDQCDVRIPTNDYMWFIA